MCAQCPLERALAKPYHEPGADAGCEGAAVPGAEAGGIAGIPEAAGSGADDGPGDVPPLPLTPSGTLPPEGRSAPGLLPAPTWASPVAGAVAVALEAAAGAFSVLPATPGVGASLRWHAASSTSDATAAAAVNWRENTNLDMRFLRQCGCAIIEVRPFYPCSPTSSAFAGGGPKRAAVAWPAQAT